MVHIVAAVVLIGCLALTLLILRARQGRSEEPRERDPELDEALDRMRGRLRRPAVVIAGAAVVGLLLVGALARNPSRWAVLLLALAVLAAGVTAFLAREHRRRADG